MALWVTKQRAAPGPVFGHTDEFEGLGIFIDTYKNNRPGVTFPYVMAMLGDGRTKYDHGNDGKFNELAGCTARGIRQADVPTKARLTYFQDSYLKLELSYKAEDQWEECFTVGDVRLPSVAYLGFSAETGELSDNHDIVSVITKSLYEPNVPGKEEGRPAHGGDTKPQGKKGKTYDPNRGESRGWGWTFIKLVLVIVGVIGAYVAYTAWRTQQRRSRF
ncbi:MAG: hypothetical protein M1839_001913 [Geoglossum umbratile]|nr:MAG: hypothetical protein M1839_001913 [Geoglossum umbratile]